MLAVVDAHYAKLPSHMGAQPDPKPILNQAKTSLAPTKQILIPPQTSRTKALKWKTPQQNVPTFREGRPPPRTQKLRSCQLCAAPREGSNFSRAAVSRGPEQRRPELHGPKGCASSSGCRWLRLEALAIESGA